MFLEISGWNLVTKFFPSLFINLQHNLHTGPLQHDLT